jgi:hypothetical protein
MYETASAVTMKPTRQTAVVQNVRWNIVARIPPSTREALFRGIPNQHILALDQNAHLAGSCTSN